jgi:hypothetical protein
MEDVTCLAALGAYLLGATCCAFLVHRFCPQTLETPGPN